MNTVERKDIYVKFINGHYSLPQEYKNITNFSCCNFIFDCGYDKSKPLVHDYGNCLLKNKSFNNCNFIPTNYENKYIIVRLWFYNCTLFFCNIISPQLETIIKDGYAEGTLLGYTTEIYSGIFHNCSFKGILKKKKTIEEVYTHFDNCNFFCLSGNFDKVRFRNIDFYKTDLSCAKNLGTYDNKKCCGRTENSIRFLDSDLIDDGRTRDIFGYKIAKSENSLDDRISEFCLITLRIPPEAKIVHAQSLKMRTNFAYVEEIIGIYSGKRYEKAYCLYRNIHAAEDAKTVYKLGEVVLPDIFDDSPLEVCTHGIHFFLSKKLAYKYGNIIK